MHVVFDRDIGRYFDSVSRTYEQTSLFLDPVWPPARPRPRSRSNRRRPQRIDRLRLDAAESIFGVDFNEAEEQMALNSVNRNLDSYEQLRKLNIPLDTEPAITFRPYLPGKKPTGKATPGAKLKLHQAGRAGEPDAGADRVPAGHRARDADRDASASRRPSSRRSISIG